MTYVVAVAKIGERADSTDPNDFIFHSSYNTFKIVLEGTKSVTLAAATNNQSFTQAHGLRFIPLVDAFAKLSTDAVVCRPNGVIIETWGNKASFAGDVKFNYISADATNITFNFDKANAGTEDVSIRYFCLEKVD
jgi:hypothetical protein